jgi:uncharacterized protein YecE (DUF72 family)
MTIKVGTASWTDPTLTKSKRFYPPGCSNAEARLRFYASQFPIVEVDSSCYAMPSAPNSVLWAERTPAGFTFNIKAFRLFTGHQTGPDMFPKAAGAPAERQEESVLQGCAGRHSEPNCGDGTLKRSSLCALQARWAPCISSSRHGSPAHRPTLRTSRIAPT